MVSAKIKDRLQSLGCGQISSEDPLEASYFEAWLARPRAVATRQAKPPQSFSEITRRAFKLSFADAMEFRRPRRLLRFQGRVPDSDFNAWIPTGSYRESLLALLVDRAIGHCLKRVLETRALVRVCLNVGGWRCGRTSRYLP